MDAADYRESVNALDKICVQSVRYHVNTALGEDDPQKPISRSLYRYLLENMAKAVSNYALEKRINNEFDFKNLVNKALEVVSDLRMALVRDWNDKSLNFWDNRSSPLIDIRTGKIPYIDRSVIEGVVVGDYLALPYRSQAIDRFLIRILIAMELYAFGDEMFNEKTFGFPARSPLKQRHVLLNYLGGLLTNSILFGGIGAAALWANSSGWISGNALGWIVGICIFLFLLLGVISTFALPFAWHKQGNARRHVVNLLTTMSQLYSELNSDGPISAQYIRNRAGDASQVGVVWPAPLFVLLDDIISRTGRF